MRKQALEFYFDFMSPFAYLAYQVVPTLVREFDLEFKLKVVDLPSVKKAAGNTGPRNVDIPLKIRYLKQDLLRWARRYGVPLNFPPTLESARINKGVFYAQDRGVDGAYCEAAWSMGWGSGGDINGDIELKRIASTMGWNPIEFLEYLVSSDAEDRYRQATVEAEEHGIFGVPTILLGDEMWWGNDRLDFLREYLETQRKGTRV
ncbi:MAG: 2-hydroxychromene-2-carboxylate isomerase [Bradyrhizobium sp.]|uniref:2-hydroxychromene-2-carboxylate isomerase n=1 Tax=Bradyrhizobium sp. TaxID=376 RepID=UPI000B5519E1|nr:2-hydroxychromene-2-carboxylate isomerase [Bradyrhizobium sp.]ART39421.1 J493 [uncultured bacterium]MDX3969221.1 2-hydroxychromene-2-carboxylate isomerase [Bradyrhizobium sp.]